MIETIYDLASQTEEHLKEARSFLADVIRELECLEDVDVTGVISSLEAVDSEIEEAMCFLI